MAVEILHLRSALGFEDAARASLRAFGMERVEEHESENYPGGNYYLGRDERLKAKVTLESDATYSDCQYWVVLQAPYAPQEFETLVLGAVKSLLLAGFDVFRSSEETRDHVTRIEYGLDRQGNVEVRPQATLPRRP